MAAAAKPFDFAAFDAPPAHIGDQHVIATTSAPLTSPAKTYSQEALDTAIADARADAEKTIVAAEAVKQTARLESIAVRLADTADTEMAGIENHIETLTNVAEAIVTEFCKATAIAHPVDTAIALLERYLRAAEDSAGASLVLPADTTKRTKTAIEKALAEHGGDYIGLTTDNALLRGELRLEWRGGAMSQTHDALAAQIKDLLAATKPGRTRISPKKEQLS